MPILDHLRPLYDLDPEDFEGLIVNDLLLGDGLKVLLLFESPHRNELQDNLPLAGPTGRSVTTLLDTLVHQICPMRPPMQTEPIGRLCGRPETGFEWLGTMNACQIPLQKKAYDGNPALLDRYANLLSDLQALKNRLDKDQDATIIGELLGQAIAADLAERLVQVQHCGLLLVPCGNVARALCAAADVCVDCRLPRVPHPRAPNAWDHAPALVQMAHVIRSELAD